LGGVFPQDFQRKIRSIPLEFPRKRTIPERHADRFSIGRGKFLLDGLRPSGSLHLKGGDYLMVKG
jgi:hypothetical protein